MTDPFLLDTDVLVDFLRGYSRNWECSP